MRHLTTAAALAASLMLSPARADELIMPQEAASDAAVEAPAEVPTEPTTSNDDTAPETAATPAPAPVAAMPNKGQTMAEVIKAFGQPKTKHKPTGGGSPRQPIITRWDYENFSVVFEKDKVINSINPQQPPKLQHTDKLKPLEY